MTSAAAAAAAAAVFTFSFFIYSLVPTDDQGIDVDILETHIKKQVKTKKANSPFSGMIFLIPSFNNPKGFCYSPGNFGKYILEK